MKTHVPASHFCVGLEKFLSQVHVESVLILWTKSVFFPLFLKEKLEGLNAETVHPLFLGLLVWLRLSLLSRWWKSATKVALAG